MELYNLTNPQKSILEVEKSLMSNTLNLLVVSIMFNTILNTDKLEKTLNKIIEMNDSFRIRILKNDNVIKQYIKEYEYENIEIIETDENGFKNYINFLKTQPLDLYNKLYNFKIVNCNNKTYVIYEVHHIINDAWGSTQVAEQIKEIYPIIDEPIKIKELAKPSYIEIIRHNEEYNKSEKYKKDKEFWTEYVKNLSTRRLYNKDFSDNTATRYETNINEKVHKKIEEYCKINSISEYTFFLSILSIYYFKVYDMKSINIGTPFLNRTKKEFENIGLFVSNIPLNIQVEQNNSFKELCEQIYKTNMKIFRHSKYPYTEIQKLYSDINVNTNMFEIGFSYQINMLNNKIGNDLGKTNWYFTNMQSNPLTIHLSSMNKKLEICFDYIKSIFTEKEIEKMSNTLNHIIFQILKENSIIISDINIITPEEKKKLTEFNNTGKVEMFENTISEKFDLICNQYSKKIAVKINEEKISYSNLYKKVCDLAIVLRNRGVKRNIPVMLFFDKSIEMIISIFAVIKAGGCYVPVLPQENEARLKYIIDDCNPNCILTTREYAKKLNKYDVLIIDKNKLHLSRQKIENINARNDLAYIIYTSGSTRKSKRNKNNASKYI